MQALRRVRRRADPWSARRLMLGSQVVLALTLTFCIVLMPQFLFRRNMGGSSNFGVHARTVVPYSVGIALSALLSLRAASVLAAAGERTLAKVARTVSALILVDLLSTYPYRFDQTWNRLHYGCGIALALAELVGAVVVADRLRDRPGYGALAVVVVGVAAMALTSSGVVHLLFAAEVITAAGFGLLLVHASECRPGPGASAPTPRR